MNYDLAYNNTHGTPATPSDNRLDPLYCDTHTDCTGAFAYPDQWAWAQQVVTSITAAGTDSTSAVNATTTYAYGLAVTGNNCPAAGSDTRCVGDNWIPAGSSDFQSFYQGEFRGFANVYITSPAGELTAQTYYSTPGWAKPANDYNNYLAGSLSQEDSYQGNTVTGTPLREIVNTFAGTIAGENDACHDTYSTLYTPCAVLTLKSRTTFFEGNGKITTPPWVQQDNTYDDYANVAGASLGAGYNNLLSQVISSTNAPTLTKKWTYTTNNQNVGGWVYHDVNKVTHSETDDSTNKVWSCQNISYDEGVAGVTQQPPTPAQGLPTTIKSYSNCANQNQTAITTVMGYDGNGNLVANVDGVAMANSGFYGNSGMANDNGCTLATDPAVFPGSWSKTYYTSCRTYESTTSQPTSVTNALSQKSHTAYDLSRGGLPISTTDVNGQVTSMAYSLDANGNPTLQVSQPGESGSYTTTSGTNSDACPGSIPTHLYLPCEETDKSSSLYSDAVSRTFYDALGRAVETRTSGPDAAHDTVVFTVYNDSAHSVFQSVPFTIATGSGFVDPNGAIDPGTGHAPTGTATFSDALGRVLAVQDPSIGSAGDGQSCSAVLTGSYTACTNYGLGSASGSGDTAIYASTTGIDPNGHVTISYRDALGRTVYVQNESGSFGGTLTPNELKSIQYSVLNQPLAVTVTDQAPQNNQTITTVTTTAHYDSLGRLTQLVDPDRGTHTYTYDPDGRVLTDVSGTRTLGTNTDLLGRVGCVQDAAPTLNATGACSAGHALVQNTYDSSAPGVTWGSTDYPIGRLTQSVATTIYPNGTSATSTQSVQYDLRGRPITQQLQLGLPTNWNVSTTLPTYQMSVGYNDANQVTTTITAGSKTSQVYDSTTGVLIGLSNNKTAIANLASLTYNSNSLVNNLTFFTSAGSGSQLASEHFTYDGDLRPVESTATWQNGSGSTGQIFDQSRWYDPASNVISLATTQASVPGQQGSGGGEVQNFCYDEQNRLVH